MKWNLIAWNAHWRWNICKYVDLKRWNVIHQKYLMLFSFLSAFKSHFMNVVTIHSSIKNLQPSISIMCRRPFNQINHDIAFQNRYKSYYHTRSSVMFISHQLHWILSSCDVNILSIGNCTKKSCKNKSKSICNLHSKNHFCGNFNVILFFMHFFCRRSLKREKKLKMELFYFVICAQWWLLIYWTINRKLEDFQEAAQGGISEEIFKNLFPIRYSMLKWKKKLLVHEILIEYPLIDTSGSPNPGLKL